MILEIHPDQTVLTSDQVREIIADHIKNGGSFANMVTTRYESERTGNGGGPNGAMSEMRSGSGV